MLRTILWLDKMAALRRIFVKRGMMTGTTSSYMARIEEVAALSDVESEHENGHRQDDNKEDDKEDDGGPIDGTPLNSLSDIKLAARICVYLVMVTLC
jgi:hypothetical protein